MALDTVLLQRGRLPHVVHDVAQNLDELDLEALLALELADDDRVARLFDDGRRRHPVERSKPSCIVMNKERAVGLEHEQANRLGQSRRQPTGVENFAAGHEQSHRRRTVLSSSDSWADGRATRTVLQWSGWFSSTEASGMGTSPGRRRRNLPPRSSWWC